MLTFVHISSLHRRRLNPNTPFVINNLQLILSFAKFLAQRVLGFFHNLKEACEQKR